MGSLIRATNLWGYAELVRELEGDPDVFLDRFQLSRSIGRDRDEFVSFRSAALLVETTADELGCPDFALRLSRWQGLAVLGPIAIIARNEQTVADGITAVARFLHAHSPALKLEVDPDAPDGDLVFRYEITEPGMSQLRQCYELSMANFARAVSLLSGGDPSLGLVSLMHDQIGSDAAYAAALDCPVRFGQSHYGFRVSGTPARRPIDHADPETRRVATRYLETVVTLHEAGLSEQVASLCRHLIPLGHCTTEAIADQLALHPRTLQRRLAEEGTSCQEVIDAERRRQAVRYLAELRLSLGQVAGLLGFAEQSSLNRACLRWFGKTPRAYRASLS